MGRTGIFGGSFNPIHNGHIHLAESVMKQLELDRIIIMPANIPPHKQYDDYIDGIHRLEMCRLAVENLEGFEVSDWELSRNDISYTYNTVMHLRNIYPDEEFFLLVGSDMFLSFEEWYRYKDILAETVLVVVSREENDSEKLEIQKCRLNKYGRTVMVNVEPIVISSTQIRKSIKNHEFYSCYLNKKVVQYIKQKKLYGE